MGREFELKYRAAREQLEKIREAFGGFHTLHMETTYYDTPEGALGRLHWTLRRRMENGVSVCTVKTKLEDGSRGEWETEGQDILEALPRLIALLHDNPCRRFGIGTPLAVGETANFTVFDLGTEYTIDPDEFLSLGKATPFAGWKVRGRCLLTVCGGEIAWKANTYL